MMMDNERTKLHLLFSLFPLAHFGLGVYRTGMACRMDRQAACGGGINIGGRRLQLWTLGLSFFLPHKYPQALYLYGIISQNFLLLSSLFIRRFSPGSRPKGFSVAWIDKRRFTGIENGVRYRDLANRWDYGAVWRSVLCRGEIFSLRLRSGIHPQCVMITVYLCSLGFVVLQVICA